MTETKPWFETWWAVWVDAEGCCMTPGFKSGEWFVFGVAETILETAPLVAHPLRKLFDNEGFIALDTNNVIQGKGE